MRNKEIFTLHHYLLPYSSPGPPHGASTIFMPSFAGRTIAWEGPVRLALDWTIEDRQHLLVASLNVGRRGVPLYWRAYTLAELKKRMSMYEREFVRNLFADVLDSVARRRFALTAERWFAV